MADIIRKLEHTAEEIDGAINEVSEARGDYDSLNERLEDLDADDRAALAEIIDGGDKNVLDFVEIGTNNSHGATFSSGGVSWTLNEDGTVTATRTEASATDSSCNLRISTGSLYVDDYCTGGYVLSGCPEGGGEDTYSLRALRGDTYRVTDTGDGILLPAKGESADIYINMLYDKEYSGTITFKPMICSQAAWKISKAYQPHRSGGSGGSGVTVYSSSDYTITPYSATNPHADYLTATAEGYLVGNLQTVHITGTYTIYYSISSGYGYKICDITVPGTIADDEIEIAFNACFAQYLTDGLYYEFFIAKIETVDSVKKLSIYCKSMGISHGSGGTNKTFDITATFKVSG